MKRLLIILGFCVAANSESLDKNIQGAVYEAKLQRIYRTLGYETPEQRGTALWQMLQLCKNPGDKKLCQQGKEKLDSLRYQHTRLAPDDQEGITDLVATKEFFTGTQAVGPHKVIDQDKQDPYEVKLQQVYKKIGSEKPEAEGSELWEMLQHCNKSSGDEKICKRGMMRFDYLCSQHSRVGSNDWDGITDLAEITNMLRMQRLEVFSRWK